MTSEASLLTMRIFPWTSKKIWHGALLHLPKENLPPHTIQTPNVPLLLAERKVKNAEKTVLIYLQIDGQPVILTSGTRKVHGSPL